MPEDAVALLTDYIDRTLRGRSSGALLFAVLLTLGPGSVDRGHVQRLTGLIALEMSAVLARMAEEL